MKKKLIFTTIAVVLILVIVAAVFIFAPKKQTGPKSTMSPIKQAAERDSMPGSKVSQPKEPVPFEKLDIDWETHYRNYFENGIDYKDYNGLEYQNVNIHGQLNYNFKQICDGNQTCEILNYTDEMGNKYYYALYTSSESSTRYFIGPNSDKKMITDKRNVRIPTDNSKFLQRYLRLEENATVTHEKSLVEDGILYDVLRVSSMKEAPRVDGGQNRDLSYLISVLWDGEPITFGYYVNPDDNSVYFDDDAPPIVAATFGGEYIWTVDLDNMTMTDGEETLKIKVEAMPEMIEYNKQEFLAYINRSTQELYCLESPDSKEVRLFLIKQQIPDANDEGYSRCDIETMSQLLRECGAAKNRFNNKITGFETVRVRKSDVE